MTMSWLDSYYEAVEFFYWEPQHIGRKKHVPGEFNTFEKVHKHLRQMEVTLNHNINQFLLLAPESLRTPDCFTTSFHKTSRLSLRCMAVESTRHLTWQMPCNQTSSSCPGPKPSPSR